MNKVFLIGRLTADPELKTAGTKLDGKDVKICNMRFVVNRKTRNGSEADYYSLKAWRELGENCSKFLKKGSKIAVSGDISIRTYQKDGVDKTIVEVNADAVEFLDTKSQEQVTSSYDKRNDIEMKPIADTDLPF